MIKDLDDVTFFETINTQTKPIIVDFYADWCGPCKMMAPLLDELAAEHSGDAVFYKVNVENAPSVVSRFGVMQVPTFASFVGGKHQRSVVGARPKQDIIDLIK